MREASPAGGYNFGMSPLKDALRSIGRLTAEEKQRVRDILDAELMQAAEKPSVDAPSVSIPLTAPGFGWAREFLVIQSDFDAPLDDFQDYM